jgi:6-phosphofructokinase 1
LIDAEPDAVETEVIPHERILLMSVPGAEEQPDFSVRQLGPRKVPSPYKACHYVGDEERTRYDTALRPPFASGQENAVDSSLSFELAGPREKVYFDPTKTRCGIVTCGGLCPGINDVTRAIAMQLRYCYGVRTIYGFRYGFEGFVPRYGHEAIMLDPQAVSHIHQQGGSILSSSRGPQPAEEVVDALERLNVQILFCIGGDGTFRGALDLCREIEKRRLKICIIGVPKTIDNDVPFTSRTFGFETAYSIAADAIRGAHVEAAGAFNGIGLLKLMGRHAGFISAHAVLASRDANFVLVPEVDFELAGANGFLSHLYRRLQTRHHAVIVVAEGAGQGLFEEQSEGAGATDPSGNQRLKDVGILLRDRISQYLRLVDIPFSLKYIDPSYLIRSAPSGPSDSLFAGTLGQMAAHAAMAGKTGMFVGYWNDQFTHVPLAAAVAATKRLDPKGNFWQSVVECTGQPRNMVNTGACAEAAEEMMLADACVGA